MRHKLLPLLTLVTVVACSGASCPQMLADIGRPPMRVLPETATLGEVMNVVNDNSSRIDSLSTNDASISFPLMPLTPSLRTNLAFDRPRKFRLRAETAITGPEVDLGSNDQLFWFWVKQNPQPAVYFCPHERFAGSAAQQLVPVDPEWLIDALGVVHFDPAGQHDGPTPVGGGRLRITSRLPMPQGDFQKVTMVDAASAWVLEQHLYDARGQLVASALASRHARDPLTGVTLPREVEIKWPATNFALRIQMGTPLINQIVGDPAELWQMPEYQGYMPVDLSDPRLQIPTSPLSAPATASEAPIQRTSWLDRIRGR